jgi:hypothetical protein
MPGIQGFSPAVLADVRFDGFHRITEMTFFAAIFSAVFTEMIFFRHSRVLLLSRIGNRT